ncbi:hypothetical protein M433DRAFT_10391 [Acidomyces richmondensis BFW]|nr:hypothetical protein M433DRAFT_10391 [Acidomyces richmondensis BFW]
MLGGEDVIVAAAVGAIAAVGGAGHEGEAAGVAVLVPPTAPAPVEADAVITLLAAPGAVGAPRLLLAALHLARLARPASCPAALLRLRRALLLRPRHPRAAPLTPSVDAALIPTGNVVNPVTPSCAAQPMITGAKVCG